jgi:hypothetical protein
MPGTTTPPRSPECLDLLIMLRGRSTSTSSGEMGEVPEQLAPLLRGAWLVS